jgi:hypothetical protein
MSCGIRAVTTRISAELRIRKEVHMLASRKIALTLAAVIITTALAAPVQAAGGRSGSRGGGAPTPQPVSRQDAFFGQSQNRQNQFFSQPALAQPPFNQNASILPPVFYSPMQLNYQGAPAGIIPGTGASYNPGFQPGLQPGLRIQTGVQSASGYYDYTVIGTTTSIPLTNINPLPRPINTYYTNNRALTQSMPRMGMMGRW